jgi:hypothetical protein
MNNQNPNIITYSNWFEVNGKKFAFRKGELFEITETPRHIPINTMTWCYLIDRKHYSVSKIKTIIKKEPIDVDVSNLQWYQQIELDKCFNLKK